MGEKVEAGFDGVILLDNYSASVLIKSSVNAS